MENKPEIFISLTDLAEIENQLESKKLPIEIANALEDEIVRATILPNKEMPNDVVALGSKAVFKVIETNRSFTKTLCLPKDINKYEDGISIFAPIGSAIIGLSTGQKIQWKVQGVMQTVEVIEVKTN
ncbi:MULTISPECIES: GreA/GreB family elongation factor [Pseudoalteromonas]|uniref:GreA/GreB family elongation factor n=1 Tax=Pseudoalteromonas TaxID=53246 RepID=UPI0020BFCB1C|nr:MULTISPECIES: GreA/GreB family elongation factor [unclassified Pseudoalteromonas]MCK8096523.1 GreA/GreB family elongation factor [Pseudoalteromonas sp. 1CM17D]MCK8135451.1 GreA/GreB family elongation factor [Pseudoalteromonas sp. 2CM28B]